MTPTPSPHSTFTSFRFRQSQAARHPSHSYDPTRNPIVNPPLPTTRVLNDEDRPGDQEGEHHGGSDEDDDNVEDIEEGADEDDEEGEEEGGIEEEPIYRRRIPVPNDFFSWGARQIASILPANFVSSPVPMEIDQPFDPASLGLKEIGNLASWTVSSCKPGCGVDALRDEDTGLFWQSDGPQPHHLNIHFSRLVSILRIRLFLDFDADESYTPTRITLLAGTGYHDLIPFHALTFEQPRGWIDVLPEGQGDDSGIGNGGVLRCFLLQLRIVENHQNGKDTHVRGLKVYAAGDKGSKALEGLAKEVTEKPKSKLKSGTERGWLVEPDWMGDPELR